MCVYLSVSGLVCVCVRVFACDVLCCVVLHFKEPSTFNSKVEHNFPLNIYSFMEVYKHNLQICRYVKMYYEHSS